MVGLKPAAAELSVEESTNPSSRFVIWFWAEGG